MSNQHLQAEQYRFPYHYLPQMGERPRMTRHWGFAPSYIAALHLVAEQLSPVVTEVDSFRHIDIGCGDGALLHYLSRLPGFEHVEMVGVDVDERAIAWARMFNPGIMFHDCAFSSLAGGFSSATMIEVLEHVHPEALPGFVQQAARLLLPGGLMVITVPSIEKARAKKHFQHFSFEMIRDILTSLFDDVQIVGFERSDLLIRWANKVRHNSLFCIDMPLVNRMLVRRMQRVYKEQRACGRILVTCRRRLERKAAESVERRSNR